MCHLYIPFITRNEINIIKKKIQKLKKKNKQTNKALLQLPLELHYNSWWDCKSRETNNRQNRCNLLEKG